MTTAMVMLVIISLIGLAMLWTIAERLEAICKVLNIAHADALTQRFEDEIDSKYGLDKR